MAEWHLTFQQHGLPVSVARADGVPEVPPEGLVRYIELAYGAWTIDPPTRSLAVEAVDWPKPCDALGMVRCNGTLRYVATGWECEICGRAEVGGLGAVVVMAWTD